jgi:very-short-patch-repair endonuclease
LRVAETASAQWGVMSLDDLRRCGLSPSAVSDRVAKGVLHRVHRGVFAVGHPNLRLEGRLLAALKACGEDAVLSHFSAAALWDVVGWDDRHPEVTVVRSGTRVHRGIRVHRTQALDARDVTRHKGIPITSPARTLVDLAAILDERPLRRAVREAQARQRVNVRQLLEAMTRLGPRRGVRKLGRIITGGAAPTRSELEDVVLDLILRGGLAHPDVNRPLIVGGRRVVPDFRWPDQHLVLEADGAAWHDNDVTRQDDAARQAWLEAHGERVVRVTWGQAIKQPEQTLTRLRHAGAPPRRRASS